MDKIDQAISDFIGSQPAMVAEFRSVLLSIHREHETVALENNTALRDVFNSFGSRGADFAFIVRSIRAGSDGSKIAAFDEMCEYACRHYRYLMGGCNGESDSGSNEQAFVEWVARGYVDVPKATDEAMLQTTLDCLGPSFIEAFDFSPAPRQRLTNTGVHYKIRGPVQRLATKVWSAVESGLDVPVGAVVAIEKRLAKMSPSDRQIVKRIIRWDDQQLKSRTTRHRLSKR